MSETQTIDRAGVQVRTTGLTQPAWRAFSDAALDARIERLSRLAEAGLPLDGSAGEPAAEQQQANRPECFGCGTRAERGSHLAKIGWVVGLDNNTGCDWAYCPACCRTYGDPTEEEAAPPVKGEVSLRVLYAIRDGRQPSSVAELVALCGDGGPNDRERIWSAIAQLKRRGLIVSARVRSEESGQLVTVWSLNRG